MAVELARKLWTVDEYEAMIEAGVLNESHHVELVRGEIVEMAPIGIRHAACVARLEELFHELLGRRVTVWGQNPIYLPNNSAPQPDVALLKRRNDAYAGQRPTAADVLLLVEVADTTLTSDRDVKMRLYAEAAIPEAWIVNLNEDTIEVYSKAVAGRYQAMRVVRRGEAVALPGELGAAVSVDEVLG